LEKLAKENVDGFDLVTVDIDEHPMLAQSCKVVSVPTVKSCLDGVLKDGKYIFTILIGFVGLPSVTSVKDFIS